MKNTINYYYNILIDDFIKSNDDYYFFLDGDEYHLLLFNRPFEDINALYKLNMQMKINGCLVHEIILNKDKQAITMVNEVPYILIKLCRYKNDKVFLNDISYIQNMSSRLQYDKSLFRDDWIKLWSDKIDYYEYQISQFGKKYPILCDSLSYFIGLGENAISYLANNINSDKNNVNINLVVSHKRIKQKMGSFEFYNPINFVVDSRVRDVSEYIKNTFFNDNFNIYELKSYLSLNPFNEKEYVQLFARMLFPTYYFDIYDEIINNNSSEDNILTILNKIDDYEILLFNLYKFIVYEKKVQLEPIEWILKYHS
ncbi:MAG: hypothetical protein J6B64_00525 [Bacilli bacterium]|nr:hypothetical protein [Bacilli bacterium]MBP3635617.1 hypothetical protein [Bacilli bacterium]